MAARPESARPEPKRAPVAPPVRDDDELERSFGLPRKQFPLLSRFGDNLTLAAARGALDQCVGRELEIERLLDVLCKRFGNNPCLVGPSGVGKTRIVHGVAQRMAAADMTDREPWIIIELSAAALVNGTGVRGGLAQRMQALRREVELGRGRIVRPHAMMQAAHQRHLVHRTRDQGQVFAQPDAGHAGGDRAELAAHFGRRVGLGIEGVEMARPAVVKDEHHRAQRRQPRRRTLRDVLCP